MPTSRSERAATPVPGRRAASPTEPVTPIADEIEVRQLGADERRPVVGRADGEHEDVGVHVLGGGGHDGELGDGHAGA